MVDWDVPKSFTRSKTRSSLFTQHESTVSMLSLPSAFHGGQRGTYHTVSDERLPRYFAEFCYRFDRRFNLV
ncbi:MAG: transposase [Candidatus Thiodiazotropha sp. (ex Lucinoma aequizonata)]|nr:transposase [Candidatus Thiodiazotropha sp. (ex Lucinoma aequizonata)]